MSIRLYVGNLSRDLQRPDFENLFATYNDDLVSVKLISDKKTGKCRGFGFVTVKTEEKADEIVTQLNGQVLEELPMKIEKALPRTKVEPETESRESSGSSKRARSTNRKPANNAANAAATVSSASTTAQPDPRWANQLEQLKAMLATQTTAP